MNQRSIILSVLSIALVVSAFPATADPIVDIALGTPLSENFDEGPGNWTANPPPAPYRPAQSTTWAWGAPSGAKNFGGLKGWATNLTGTYAARDCGAILSPPIDLSGASSASVSFMQWRHMEESTAATSFAFDGGLLFVTTDGGITLTKVTPAGGYTSKNLSSTARSCLDDQPHPTKGLSGPAGTAVPPLTLSAVTTDLSAFAGQTVRFAIAFGADSSVHRAGWFIDSFSVTIDGSTTTEDFESSNGGFTIVSTAKPVAPIGWQHGTPAPGGPNMTGITPMWATNINGNYESGECAWVESPSFMLGDVADPGLGILRASLSWNQWFRSNSVYTAGIVQVGVHSGENVTYEQITPIGGYPGKIDSTYVQQLVDCLGVPAGSGSFEGLVDAVNGPMRAYQADISNYTGQEISIRFFFASAWSSLNPTLYPGWYVDDVNVDLALQVEGPDVESIIEDNMPSAGGADAPGWTSGGEGSTWAYGASAYGGTTGEIVYATNLSGYHEDPECSWIDSPEMPGALLAIDPTFTIEHFYDIYGASTAGAAWSGAAVFVSTNGGANWTYLDLAEYDLEARYTDTRACMHSIDPSLPTSGTVYSRVFSGNHSEWETVSIDLSEYSDSPTVKVRIMFSSGIAIFRDGYNLRSATYAGIPIL